MVDITDNIFNKQIAEHKISHENFITISTCKNWMKSDKLLKKFIIDKQINIKDIIRLIQLIKTNQNLYILPTKTKTVQHILNIIYEMHEAAYDDNDTVKTNKQILKLFCSVTSVQQEKIKIFRNTPFYKNNYSQINNKKF